MKALKLTISLLFIALLAGCGRVQPILNFEDSPVAFNLQTADVKAAIVVAATNRGWVITGNEANEMTAKIVSRTHSATVRISYSEKFYSIIYVESSNLKESNGNIHRNYNRWVNNLNADIQKQLAVASVK